MDCGLDKLPLDSMEWLTQTADMFASASLSQLCSTIPRCGMGMRDVSFRVTGTERRQETVRALGKGFPGVERNSGWRRV